MRNRISKEAIETLYCEMKFSQASIGLMFNCDRKNVDYYMKKYGIPKRKSTDHLVSWQVDFNEIREMLESGMLAKEIAAHYGVSSSTLWYTLRDNGVNLKNHKTQREKQSAMMRARNPVPKGTTRPKELFAAAAKARKAENDVRYNFITTFKEYSKISRAIAYQVMGKQRGDGLVIDHIFSVKDGFLNGVHVRDISHKSNLRLINKTANLRKASKSLVTLDEFYLCIGVQRLSREGVEPSGSKSGAHESVKI